MSEKPSFRGRFSYYVLEQFEDRCRRRLREDLGVNPAGVEVILHMRSQILALQRRLHELEATLGNQQIGQNARLAGYRQVYYEATWQDISEENSE